MYRAIQHIPRFVGGPDPQAAEFNTVEELLETDWILGYLEWDEADHFVQTKERDCLMVATTIKSILTVDIFKEFNNLKSRFFWGSGLFSRGTYYGSAGTVSGETIKKYIENQKFND